ncbi:MAG: PLP-dependent lyase/thiolase [Candidatus Paceibacterota bacterium]
MINKIILSIIAKKMYDSNVITPQEQQQKLAKAIGYDSLWFKREDLHPYGSHKGRSIPVMIDKYYTDGDRNFAISSSGNAALAAALHVRKNYPDISLNIFVGNKINPDKHEILKDLVSENIKVLIKERPLQALTQASNEGFRSLRQSFDDTSLIGYQSLAEEIMEIKDLGAVFIGTSSGTTAEALARTFVKNKRQIQVHIIQTSSCHPIYDKFEAYDGPDEISTADAIVDQTAYRGLDLVPLIEKTGGHAWCATNENISAAKELVSKHTGLDVSTNSALSIVGAMQTMYQDYEINGSVLCMICGK